MRWTGRLVSFVLGTVSPCWAWSQLVFSDTERSTMLTEELEALRSTPTAELTKFEKDIADLEQRRCRSLFPTSVVDCLMKETRLLCGTTIKNDPTRLQFCYRLADLIVVNKINDRLFLSKEERFAAPKKSHEPGMAIQKALENKYAMLTAEMILGRKKEVCKSGDRPCISGQVDRFCTERSDTKGLAWQACAGAIVWFIGRNEK